MSTRRNQSRGRDSREQLAVPAGQGNTQVTALSRQAVLSNLRNPPRSQAVRRPSGNPSRRDQETDSANNAVRNNHLTTFWLAVFQYMRDLWRAWNQFWFTAMPPFTLAMIRVLAGGMLFYTHLIWTLDLQSFLGSQSWVTPEMARSLHRDSFAWSYLWYIDSPTLLVALHIGALVVFGMLAIGLFTRATSILAAIITLSYCHRLPGSLFGLDQINAMLAMYLAVGHSGAAYSFDRWLARRRGGEVTEPAPSITTNIAIRLIQIHMCVIYLFGGIGKMRGELWWDGFAVWYAIANYEYQSVNVMWLVHYPWLIALLTHVTVFWETFYAFLIWPKYTRPIMLIIALLVHAGIAIFLGMPTFGIAMIIGNLAFIRPETVARLVRQTTHWH